MFNALIKILLAFTVIFNFILGFVFLFRKKTEGSKIFSLINFSVGLWALFILFYWITINPGKALFFSKCAYTFASLIPVFFLRFILIYPYRIRLIDRFPQVNIVFLIIFAIWWLVWSNRIVRGVTFEQWGYNLIPARFYIFYIFYFSIYMGMSFIILFFKMITSSGLRKLQLKYVFAGGIISSMLGSIPNLILPFLNNTRYTFAGPIFSLILVICIAYVILKYRLMNITVAITSTGVFVTVYTLVLGLPFILAVSGKRWLIAFLDGNWWSAPLVLMALLATVGPSVYLYFQKRAERLILKEQFTYRRTLEEAARQLAGIHSLKKLLTLIVHMVTKTVRISYAAIYLYNEDSGVYKFSAGRSYKEEKDFIPAQNPLMLWLEVSKKPLVYEDIIQSINYSSEDNTEAVSLKKEMEELKAAVVVPAFLKGNLLGVLILGNKRSGKPYTLEDLNTFSVLANEASLAVENARLYENMEDQIKKRTEELIKVQKQLIQAEKLATVGTLAGGVAHEINNPLTAVLTNAQMLLMDTQSFDEDTQESLQLIEKAAQRCRIIVKKLMTYAKKPAEQDNFGKIDLLTVLKNSASLIRYQLAQENVSLDLEAEGGSYVVMGNQNELEQVFINLIINAKDAVKQAKGRGAVKVRFFKEGKWVKVSVIDKGIGIAPDILPKIFDPFFTTKDVGKGTGLGLSICQKIIERHKGEIVVRSQPNKGSVFTVCLPGGEALRGLPGGE